MAWSDAARAAALEARRIHARTKQDKHSWQATYAKGESTHASVMSRPSVRKDLATKLKSMRKGMIPTLDRIHLSFSAARSTALRNAYYGGAKGFNKVGRNWSKP